MWEVGVGLALCVSASACGKKGPPLAPLVPIPAAVELIDAARLGSDVYVSVTLPVANIDEFTPADIARVEIYGYTGRTPPSRARWVELATLVATVPVAPPPPPAGRPAAQPSDKTTGSARATSPEGAPLQGERITIRDILTPDELVQGKEAPAIRDPRSGEPVAGDRGSQPAAPRPRAPEPPLNRYYTAVPFNTRGRPGPPGGVAEFPLLPVPPAPPSLDVSYTERSTVLAWEPSGGLIGFLLERALPEEPIPFEEDEESEALEPADPPGPLAYHVYREIAPDPMTPPAAAQAIWREEPPPPVTAAPVPVLEFVDTLEFGRRRCYTVRAVRGLGPAARLGDASPTLCVTPIDTFAPAPPRSLAAVASEGVISLIWEPNAELDLGGYVVLRGEAPGDTLQPLTPEPVPDARYRDASVQPGIRYVYTVIAVDNRFPVPNMSPESSRVEETAR
jgi:hypothetical protein